MKLKCLCVFLLTLILLKGQAQSEGKELLFTVDNDSIYTSEFIRVYTKNLDLVQDETQKDVDVYLDMFINYKLKLKEAKSLELDKKPSYIKELANYKKQLAQSFIADHQVTEALVEEAYERTLNEVEASHILIMLDQNAGVQDTLEVYNTLVKLRNRAIEEGFETVRKEVHNGQTIFGEDLGYFNAFKMVYPFESVAYKTQIGDISQPFRTQFGYHIVYVKNKRKSQGTRTVAHVMVMDNKEEPAETRIWEIYKKIGQGVDFESLAKQFSEDANSAGRGGLLTPFTAGQLSSREFEEVAFSLETIGDVSEPFKSNFGWHIVKLYDKTPVGSFQDLKPQLEAQVKRDDRSRIIDKALYEKLKAKYRVSSHQPALPYFAGILNENYFKGSWQLPQDFDGSQPLVKIENKQLNFADFGKYLMKSQGNNAIKGSYLDIVVNAYETFINANLVQYQESNLEHENADFADILNEYKDGLLLFDLMEHTIWNTSPSDSLEIRKFYDSKKAHYTFPERIDAVVASTTKQNVIKRVAKLLASDLGLDEIKNLVNSRGNVRVVFTSEIMDATHQALPEGFGFKKGMSKVYRHHNDFVVVKVNDVLPEQQKEFEEVKGEVISEYQAYKEAKWLEELKLKYKVVVNQAALNKVKSQINQL